MLRRPVVIVPGLVLALAAATSASAQGRHAVKTAVTAVAHVVGISSDDGNQGNVDEGAVNTTDEGAVNTTDEGDQGNVDEGNVNDSNEDDQGTEDEGDQGNVDEGDDGNQDEGDQGTTTRVTRGTTTRVTRGSTTGATRATRAMATTATDELDSRPEIRRLTPRSPRIFDAQEVRGTPGRIVLRHPQPRGCWPSVQYLQLPYDPRWTAREGRIVGN